MRAAVGACAGLEREMRCAVDARNEPARRLYEGLGFRESGRRVAYVGLVKDLLPRKR
jgi:ribosomal protein S18 acetylase RimI-like enzyme